MTEAHDRSAAHYARVQASRGSEESMLDAAQRVLISDLFESDLSIREAARVLAMNPSTLKGRLRPAPFRGSLTGRIGTATLEHYARCERERLADESLLDALDRLLVTDCLAVQSSLMLTCRALGCSMRQLLYRIDRWQLDRLDIPACRASANERKERTA